MVPSDRTGPVRHRTWRTGVLAVLAALLLVAGLFVVWQAGVFASLRYHFGSGFDERRFDRLEADFGRDRAAFVAVDARMRELVAQNPTAARIGWSHMLICVRGEGEPIPGSCRETTAADQELFTALPGASVVIYQAKDPGRAFFRFFHEDPPQYTIMHAPADTDPEEYAEDRGFRGARELEPGWTVLGPIPDENRADEQWIALVTPGERRR